MKYSLVTLLHPNIGPVLAVTTSKALSGRQVLAIYPVLWIPCQTNLCLHKCNPEHAGLWKATWHPSYNKANTSSGGFAGPWRVQSSLNKDNTLFIVWVISEEAPVLRPAISRTWHASLSTNPRSFSSVHGPRVIDGQRTDETIIRRFFVWCK